MYNKDCKQINSVKYIMNKRYIKMKKQLIMIAFAFFAGAMVGIHRRVIKAYIAGEPIPVAPASHFWCENRRAE